MRELIWAAEGRRRDAWDRASLLAALVFNQNRKRSELRHPRDFHPYLTARRRQRITANRIGDLKIFLPAAERRRLAAR